jgi:hypothetical protein
MRSVVRSLPILAGLIIILIILNALASYSVSYVSQTLSLDVARTVSGVYSAELVARVAVLGLCVWKVGRVVTSVEATRDYAPLFADRAFLLILALLAFMAASLDNRLYMFTRVLNGELRDVLEMDGAYRAAFMALSINCVGVLLLNFKTVWGAISGLALMTCACVLGFIVAVSVI